MKKHFAILAALLVLLAAVGSAFAADEGVNPLDYGRPETLKTINQIKSDRFSYALGMYIGKDLTGLPFELNAEELSMGIQAMMSGGSTRMTIDEMKSTLQEMQEVAVAQQMAQMQQEAAENLAKEKEFLAQNSSRAEVTTLPSGLQYEVLTEGDGQIPTAEDIVIVDYTGHFVDGREFASSIASGEPATFPVAGIIPGWGEALQLMPVGSKWKIYIPSSLAYGEQGMPPAIAPNSMLIFELELKQIQ